jgi:hypothetical protein
MTFTQEQVEQVIERTAQILADSIKAQVGDMADYPVFDIRLAAQMVGLSPRQVPTYLPVTETSAGKHGVTIGAIKAHIDSRTKPPTGIKARRS